MTDIAHQDQGGGVAALRRGLRQAGPALEADNDLAATLALVLAGLAAREHAQGGTLYLLRDGQLHLAAVQHVGRDLAAVSRELLSQRLSPGAGSLEKFVGRTGRTMAVSLGADSSIGGPLPVDRDYDAAVGEQTESALAVRLEVPGGRAVGVLKLVNRLSPSGKVLPFAPRGHDELGLLASIGAVAIDKSLAYDEMRWKHMETILRLSAAAELRDGDMMPHVRRISGLSALIAKSLGLPAAEAEQVRYASPMHDIGKTRMPDSVLGKTGPLSEDDARILRRHTLVGAQLLDGLPGDVMSAAHDVALSHHERWDGEGYPHGRRKEEAPLCGRIVALADAFDAMVTRRPYRQPYSFDMALETVRTEREKHFDPEVARAFLLAEDRIDEIYRT